MPIGKKSKQEDLERLERFVKEDRVSRFVSNLWYDSLRTAYQFEFICLARKYNKSSPGQKRLIQETMSFVK